MFTLSRLGIFAYNMMWAKRSLKVILVWVAHLIQFVCLSVNIKPVEVITCIMVRGWVTVAWIFNLEETSLLTGLVTIIWGGKHCLFGFQWWVYWVQSVMVLLMVFGEDYGFLAKITDFWRRLQIFGKDYGFFGEDYGFLYFLYVYCAY